MVSSLTLTTEGLERPFYFREKTSDEGVIVQVFRQQQYAFHHWQRAGEILSLVERRRAEGRQPLIIDAGANIGASAVYFAAKIPSARIVAIEPSIENFELLKRNTEGLDVDLRLAALGVGAGSVRVVDPGLSHWGYRTERVEAEASSVAVLSMNEIYNSYDQKFFPLLAKIDIEGAEKEVFAQDTQWVRKTPLIVVEPHDWMLPKSNTIRGFLRLLADDDRDILVQGEHIVAIANSFE
jgi:FkbM family methyltransferase